MRWEFWITLYVVCCFLSLRWVMLLGALSSRCRLCWCCCCVCDRPACTWHSSKMSAVVRVFSFFAIRFFKTIRSAFYFALFSHALALLTLEIGGVTFCTSCGLGTESLCTAGCFFIECTTLFLNNFYKSWSILWKLYDLVNNTFV